MPKIEEAPVTVTPETEPTQAGKPAAKNGKPKKSKKDHPVVYPDVQVKLYRGEEPLTVDKAKELLGWEEVKDENYHLMSGETRIRLANFTRNRPFSPGLAKQYVQEHLNRRWRLNGETVVIGKTGEVLSGQHRLGSLVLAESERVANPHWEENWPGPVTMETVVVVGVDEQDEVVNTLDTGKPRSLPDVLYRSEHFADYAPKLRHKAAVACGHAVRMLWSRTGADKDAFAPRRTHSESLAFLDSHRTLAKRIVRHVVTEDAGEKLSQVLSLGYLSALAYLAAQGKTDPAQYRVKAKEGTRSEKYFDMELLDGVEEFLTCFSSESPAVAAVSHKLDLLGKRKDEAGELVGVTLAERMALVTLAWVAFVEKGKVESDDVKLRYVTGTAQLKDVPTFGGIDLGDDPDEAAEPDEVEDEEEQAEVEAEKAKIAEEKAKPKTVAEEIRDQFAPIAEAHPGVVIFIKSKTSGDLATIDDMAEQVGKALGHKVKQDANGIVKYTMLKGDVAKAMPKLLAAGLKVAVAEKVSKGGIGNSEVKVTPVTK